MNDVAVPETLADAVRRVAAAVPASAADLGGLRQRYRRRRRRRVAATAGLAAVVVGAAATTVPLLARGGTGSRPNEPVASSPGAPPVTEPAPAPVQRLMLAPFSFQQPPPPDHTVGEVLPDGSVVFRPVSEVDHPSRVVPLPDGRLVLLGPVDLTPGVIEQPDGPMNPAVGFMLVVQGNDGRIELSRDVRVIGEDVPLLGATDTEAYLLRPAGVVAHDYATGHERLILPASALPVDRAAGRGVDVTASRIAFGTATCRVQIFDLATAQPIATLAPPPGCTTPGEVRLSPGGSLVAVNYSIGSPHNYPEPIQTRLAVIDVATGATKLDTLLFEGAWQMAVGEGYTMFGTRPNYLQGMAWWTVDSLRLAIRHDGVLSLRVVTVP